MKKLLRRRKVTNLFPRSLSMERSMNWIETELVDHDSQRFMTLGLN